ncbi:MAG: hypothetical protein HUU37_08755, partial [Bdellovibrionales bacterium]|nr:hypothetical protein [Bdellovibrionales bacterium]
MESIALLFTKFSSELISAQIALLCLGAAVSVYWMLIRYRGRHRTEWVPAALVKEYLDGVVRHEKEIRYRLFGEEARVQMAPAASASAPTVQQVVVQGADPAVMKELEALRAQLAVADQRALEFDRNLNAAKAEKEVLEKKLKEAPAPAAGGGGADPAVAAELAKMKKDAEDLRAKLAEYEVIEDDLANLKKYQMENKALREQLEGKGAAPVAVAAAPAVAAPAPAPEPAPAPAAVAAAPEATASPAPAP